MSSISDNPNKNDIDQLSLHSISYTIPGIANSNNSNTYNSVNSNKITINLSDKQNLINQKLFSNSLIINNKDNIKNSTFKFLSSPNRSTNFNNKVSNSFNHAKLRSNNNYLLPNINNKQTF